MSMDSRLAAGRRLFSFAVVADTHVNEAEDRTHSPFATNALANGRARHVLHEIAALEPAPAFLVHLGDIVHPVPSLPAYAEAVARYKSIAEVLRMPVHLVPGNHDLGDKCLDWMPADVVCDSYVETYRRAFGADYYAFDHAPLRCIVINALLINSGLAGEAAQRDWLEAELAARSGRRLFFFIHYPPYVLSADEDSTYDNIDRPGRDWLLGLVRRYAVEALFAGHVHNFWYDRIDGTELYMLPSTAFLRHDYSEFYRVAPGSEFGRGDVGKFGYCIVDVHERGHAMRLVRTNGRTLAPGEAFAPRRALPPIGPKAAAVPNVGVELRHPWAEILEIPATGGVQEFGRKPARNDYPVMALWEMGARLLKVPEQDLVDPATRARMDLLHSVGHRFVAASLGLPSPAAIAALGGEPGLVEAIAFNLGERRLAAEVERVRDARRGANRPLYWSKLRLHEDARFDGAQFSHFVRSGLLPRELEGLERRLGRAREAIDGVVVRLERGVDLLAAVPQLARFADASGLGVIAEIKLADANLARARDDDVDTARLAAEAVLAACAAPRVMWIFDTFMDVDRGYHPRNGFIDRRFNPRPALRAYGAMVHLLRDAGPVVLESVEQRGELRLAWFSALGARQLLVCGGGAETAALAAHCAAEDCIDLLSAEIGAPGTAPRGVWLLRQMRREAAGGFRQ
jgi:hypothetical protein